MSYPTVNFRPTGQALGLQPIAETSATQRHSLGTICRAFDDTYGEGEFIYLAGVASTAAGDLAFYNSKTGATVRAVHGGTHANGPACVAMSANVASQYGWYQISGAGPVKAGTVAADGDVYLTSTAGQVDDAVVAADNLDGACFKAADSGGYATVQLSRPSLTAESALQAPLYCTLAAAVEAGDAIVVTGQVKNLAGVNASAATQVMVRSLAVTANAGDITVTAGTEKKTVNPATGENVSWIETTAAGAFAVSIANAAAEVTLVEATPENGLTAMLKITFT